MARETYSVADYKFRSYPHKIQKDLMAYRGEYGAVSVDGDLIQERKEIYVGDYDMFLKELEEWKQSHTNPSVDLVRNRYDDYFHFEVSGYVQMSDDVKEVVKFLQKEKQEEAKDSKASQLERARKLLKEAGEI